MQKTTEIHVAIEDKPGTLAALCSTLGNEEVNIDALLALGGSARLLVNDVEKGTNALKKAGYQPTTKAVVMAEVPNKPGALSTLARKIADKGVNINCTYQTTLRSSDTATVVFGVANPDVIAGL
ncbi:MAG: hypothetical protein ACE5H0_04020 [Bacteroidota bacterium]